nr:glycosyltransferase [Capnocytophaga sp. oral taxon 323]
MYHFIGGNKGIATAQNIGINYFKQNKYAFIIFFDQDSIPPIDLVEHLYRKYKFLYEKK